MTDQGTPVCPRKLVHSQCKNIPQTIDESYVTAAILIESWVINKNHRVLNTRSKKNMHKCVGHGISYTAHSTM